MYIYDETISRRYETGRRRRYGRRLVRHSCAYCSSVEKCSARHCALLNVRNRLVTLSSLFVERKSPGRSLTTDQKARAQRHQRELRCTCRIRSDNSRWSTAFSRTSDERTLPKEDQAQNGLRNVFAKNTRPRGHLESFDSQSARASHRVRRIYRTKSVLL